MWPSLAQFAQQVDDRRLRRHIHAGERLVEQDHAPALRERAREKHALLLPAGQLADLPVAEIHHADALETFLRDPSILRARDPQEIHVAVAAHHHHVPHADRETPVDLLALRHVGDQIALLRSGDIRPPRLAPRRGAGWTKPMIALNSVDLPLPFTPTSAQIDAAPEMKDGVAQRHVAIRIGDGDVAQLRAGAVRRSFAEKTLHDRLALYSSNRR